MSIERKVDAWGRVTINTEQAFEFLLQGGDLSEVFIEPDAECERYNRLCRENDKLAYLLSPPPEPTRSPEEEHAERAATWLIPEAIRSIDVREFLLSMCVTPEQSARVNEEMDLFEARGLIPVLRLMIHLVDRFREKGVVWGVGRGSSVASYCLYLIGINRIDPMRYGLEIGEFLR